MKLHCHRPGILSPQHMIWIAPSEKDTNNAALEKRLGDAAEQAVPAPHFAETDFNGGRPQGLLGLIFLRFAEVRFATQRAQLEKASAPPGVAAAWMNPPPTTPRASFICPPRHGSITCSTAPKPRTSARRSRPQDRVKSFLK